VNAIVRCVEDLEGKIVPRGNSLNLTIQNVRKVNIRAIQKTSEGKLLFICTCVGVMMI
jgi:hypothetical protein